MTDIIFLGTGGDTVVITKCIRNSSGIVIKHEDVQFYLDPGPNALFLSKCNNVNLRETTAILCSSSKMSQSNDVNAVISAMTYNGLDVKGVLVAPKMIVEGNESNYAMLQPHFKKCVEKIIFAEPEKKISIQNIDIHFLEANDYTETVALKIYMPDLVIGYSSDTSYSDKFGKQFEGCDVLIMNIQNPEGINKKNQMNTRDAIKFVKKVKPQLAIMTRFGKSMIDADPLQEARKVHNETKVQVMAVIDGQKISASSYNTKSKQKRLK